MRGQIILSHGSDSSPEATKVSTLATQAEARGWATYRPDFGVDDARGHAHCVAPRVARLRATIEALDQPPLLVGSSMGAFVSGLVSLEVPVAGMLLLATPSEIPGYAQRLDLCSGVPTVLIHGWRDDVCPLAGVYQFAGQRKLPLFIVDDDHRLGASMDIILTQFHSLLDHLVPSA